MYRSLPAYRCIRSYLQVFSRILDFGLSMPHPVSPYASAVFQNRNYFFGGSLGPPGANDLPWTEAHFIA